MNLRRAAFAFGACATLLCSFGFAVRQAREWHTQQLAPHHAFLDHLDATIPGDARVLVLAPRSAWRHIQICQLNTRLHPRPVFVLPPGVETLEGAGDWIRQKRLTWVVYLGGPEFDAGKAYSRRLDDGR